MQPAWVRRTGHRTHTCKLRVQPPPANSQPQAAPYLVVILHAVWLVGRDGSLDSDLGSERRDGVAVPALEACAQSVRHLGKRTARTVERAAVREHETHVL